jgi:uncharacterized membrane protein
MQALDLFDNYSLLSMILGEGLHWTDNMPHGGIVEIDIIDTLMTYGILGVLLVYGFLFLIIYKTYFNKNHAGSKATVLLLLLLTGISLTAGHVIFSGVSAPLIAGALAYGLNSKSLTPRKHALPVQRQEHSYA